MEPSIDINQIFPERITVLDQNLVACRKTLGRPDPEHQIAAVIDELGRASAKAQHLTAPITSASKLQTAKHHLYLIKDGESNGEKGLAVGFLKVGYKKLFLLDQRGTHMESEPLCVLDFFVKETLQRHGYGLELFEFMLQHKKVKPDMMAYDRPSTKFLSFLEKHYSLRNSVPQVNNFVVFDGFFTNRSAARSRKVPHRKPDGEIKPYSLTEREALREEQRVLPWPLGRPVPPPSSPQLLASSLCSPSMARQRPDPALAPAHVPGACRSPSHRSPLIDSLHSREKRTSQQGLIARNNLYSRHTNTRGVGLQMETLLNAVKLPGLGPGQRVSGTNTGGETDPLGHTDRTIFVSLPPLSRKESLSDRQTSLVTREPDRQTSLVTREPDRQTSLVTREPDRQTSLATRTRWGVGAESWPPRGGKGGPMEVEEKPGRGAANGGRSWTVGENRCNAQWVRQNQNQRSTRPW
ncbi:hypothetical protein DPEC_G00287820 [Dallia pectoralis]|uniref:Uncharacterized protein n=1 Tax=Dallia pectoralis TaxID=75939 RepID=A0ACC2FKB7_DALPE|nr:hypothetical protein DPEC_G00287820 [Dallia pectoralis]